MGLFVEVHESARQEACFTIRDANGHALAHVYFEGELDR
jgi:hypothetical protein